MVRCHVERLEVGKKHSKRGMKRYGRHNSQAVPKENVGLQL